jgi:uncharacterized glyoxalase superfamily protein PhnB
MVATIPLPRAPSIAVTAIRYRNVDASAKWLQSAFGFNFRAKMLDDEGRVEFVQLTCGNHLFVMVPVGVSELDAFMRQPDEIGGAETQSCYLVVDDVQQHHSRAHAAGAHIVSAVKAFDKGGQGYTCRDPEGHLWSFGSYDPWSEPSVSLAQAPASSAGKRLSMPGSFAALGAVLVLGACWVLWHAFTSPSETEVWLLSQLELANKNKNQAIELAARHKADMIKERAAGELLRLESQRANDQLALERQARESAEKSLHQSEMKAAVERSAKIATEEAAEIAEVAARERALKDTAEDAAAAAMRELMVANAARLAAAKEAAEQARRERPASESEINEAHKPAHRPSVGKVKSADQPARTKKAANVPGSEQPFPPMLPW